MSFITLYYFSFPNNIRLNSTHYFSIKRKLQEIAFNHSSEFDFQDFMNLYKKCTAKPYSVLFFDTTFALDYSLHFNKNLLEKIQKLIMTIDEKIKSKRNYKTILTEKKQNVSIIIR